MTKEESKQKVAKLVNKYEKLSAAEIKKQNEEATKQGFILPLFKALGWDTEDTTNEVIPEENASKGRVDFAFKLKGVPQFYLEAKPLKADLNNPDYKKQAVTYAYNKGVTWAVLTDFESLRIFNSQTGNPALTLVCKDYITSFDDLWLLSQDSLTNGLLKKYAQQHGHLPQQIPIEKRLYAQLRQWRESLYNEIHDFNKDLKLPLIDETIQRLFNRLIFIRTCEDRTIEEKKLLAAVNQWETGGHKKDKLIEALRSIFAYFNDTYDSELFEKHLLDSDKVFLFENTLKDILHGLYDISGGLASYDFGVIKPDVLGAVYEQYLGYVATKVKQQAEKQMKLGIAEDDAYAITSKKERRKEQGIYYTPEFVTDYIVRETVGRFIKEHDYNEIRNIKILDPACGSGSFLIRAYDELLQYHAKERNLPLTDLPQQDRLPVLLGNIFGVDLDMQAVEIARLNLLLRTVTKKGKLPFISDNIRQGNSLISGTPEELKGYFGDGYKAKKPFTWEQEFPDIMKNGGFDVVIGNPPYGAEFDEDDRKYIADRYPESKDNKNSAMVFIEKGLSLTKEGGYFSFIIPKSLAYSQKWASGRKLILDKLGYTADASKAFKEVLLEQMVIVVSQNFKHNPFYEAINLDEEGEKDLVSISKEVSQNTDSVLLGVTETGLQIFNKMTSSGLFMKDISKTSRGLPFQKYLTKNPKGVPIYRGDHIGRYELHETKETLPEEVLSNADKKVSFLRQPKILSQRIIAHVQNPQEHIILMSTFDKEGILTLDTIENTVLTQKTYSYSAITALLNSKLWSWYEYRFTFSKAIRTMDFDEYYLNKLPLPAIDKEKNKQLASLAEKMLELNKKLTPIKDIFSNERDALVKEIEKTDKEIDNLVYDLYGLNEEERKIVEGGL